MKIPAFLALFLPLVFLQESSAQTKLNVNSNSFKKNSEAQSTVNFCLKFAEQVGTTQRGLLHASDLPFSLIKINSVQEQEVENGNQYTVNLKIKTARKNFWTVSCVVTADFKVGSLTTGSGNLSDAIT